MTPRDLALALLVSSFGVFVLAAFTSRARHLLSSIGVFVSITGGLVFFSNGDSPEVRVGSQPRLAQLGEASAETFSTADLAAQTPEAILLEVKRLVPQIPLKYGSERDSTLRGLAGVQAKMGDYKGARESLSQMELNQEMWIEAILIDSLISAGQLEEAKQTAEAIGANEIGARILSLVAEAYAKNGRVDDALRIASGIDKKYDLYNVYGLIARAQAQAGDVDGALKTSEKFLNAHGLPGGDFRKWYAVSAIVKSMAEAGKVDDARVFIAGVEQPYGRDYGLWGVVQGQLAAGDLEGAIATSESIPAPHAKALALHDIAKVEIETGKRDDGIARLRNAARIGKEIADSRAQGGALWAIASRQAKAGDVEGALQSAAMIEGRLPDDDAIMHTDQKRDALARILGTRADAGDIEGVRKTIAALHDSFGDADKELSFGLSVGDKFVGRNSTVDALVQAHVRAGDIDGAMKIVGTLPNDKASFGLTDIAQAYAEGGDMTEALRITGEIKEVWQKDGTLSGIALEQAKAGSVSDAVRTISQMQRGDEKDRALYALGNIQVETSGRGGDFEWVGKLKEPSEQTSALLGIASAMMDESKAEKTK